MNLLLRVFLFTVGGLSVLLDYKSAFAQQVIGIDPTPNTKTAPINTSITITNSAVIPITAKLHVFSAQAGGKKAGTNQVAGATDLFIPDIQFRPGERVLVTGTDLSANGFHHVFEFTTAANGGTGNFSGATEVGIGPFAHGLTSADVDGDGDLDILAASYNSSTVSVRLNDGHGIFSGSIEVSVGNAPLCIACADVDGDGDLDILTGNAIDDTISVRLNDGHGSFSGSTEIKVGRTPIMMAIADVDGDGDLDILTANYNAGAVGVQLNDGHGMFVASTAIGVGAGPQSVVSMDVDGDGDLDFLTANSVDNTVSVRLNNGHGIFSGSTEVRLWSGNPTNMTGADVDGDGDMDFLTANSNGNSVSVLFNDGHGMFSGTTTVYVGQYCFNVTTADVDGDGDLDILSANEDDHTVGVRFNDGHGIFSGSTQIPVGRYVRSVVCVDVDGDGDLDILALNDFDNTVSVRLNQNRVPLPIHLTDFTAQFQGDWVQLKWKTAWETNFAGFWLQRATDAKEFSLLGWIPTQFNELTASAYAFNDLSLPPTATTLYYRLQMVDQDGSMSYSSIRSVSRNPTSLSMLVLGNPVRGNLRLMVNSPSTQSLQLRLLSSAGQLVNQQTLIVSDGRNQLDLGIGPVAAGMYELVLSDGLNQRSQRLVIE